MYLSLIPGAITDVDSTAEVTPGSRYVDEDGNVYIYALGVANTAAGSWVALNLETTGNTPKTALLTHAIADYGVSVAVAKAAIGAGYYGWYCIAGVVEGLVLASDAADALQYTSGTAGSLDDTSTTQTKILGVRLVDTRGGTAGLATFFINHPRTKA